jgi:hypothetical protein
VQDRIAKIAKIAKIAITAKIAGIVCPTDNRPVRTHKRDWAILAILAVLAVLAIQEKSIT